MKKILMNAAIATGLALFAGNAFAADPNAFVSSIGFETNPQGPLNLSGNDGRQSDDNTYWNTLGDVESTFVTNYTDTAVTPPTSRPDLFAGDEFNKKFLKIDSPNGFERYMQLGGAAQSLESDVFVDMNVQFTVSDTVLDLGENTDEDKLAIWLYAPDTDGAETNLVITAAELNGDKEPTLKNFVIGGVDIQPDTWYRLTVKAVGEAGFPPKFNVYIDGDEDKLEAVATLAADGTKTSLDDAVSDFYSLVEYNSNKPTTKTLSSVTFQGVGALDDLAFTTTAPDFTEEVVTYNFSATIGEKETFANTIGELVTAGANEITLLADEYDISGEAATGLEVTGTLAINLNGKALTFADTENPAVTVTGSFTLAGTGSLKNTAEGGMAFIVAGGSLVIGTSAADDVTVVGGVVGYSESGYSIKYFSSTEPELAVVNEAGDTLAWAQGTGDDANYWIVSSGEQPPEPSEDDLDPAAGTIEVTVKAGTAAAAEAAAKAAIAVPSGATVDKAVYAEYFTYSAEAAGEGSFTVTITGIKEEIEADVLESAVERLTDDKATTIAVPAGLYYSITPSTALPISGEAVKGLSTGGAVSVDKPGTTAGFYEIKISPTAL